MSNWRVNALRRGYEPGKNVLADTVWDLPDFPVLKREQSAEERSAILARHKKKCDAWQAKMDAGAYDPPWKWLTSPLPKLRCAPNLLAATLRAFQPRRKP